MFDHSAIEPLSDVFIQFGDSFVWQKYSLMILIGMVMAALLGIREGNKLGIRTADIIDGVLIIVPLSIVGTRLWYVIFEFGNTYLPVFQNQGFLQGMRSVIDISSGGLAIHGGFITAFVSAYFYTKIKGINLFAAFDIMVPGFLIAQASGRWGNFFNQEAHGGIIGGTNLGSPALSLDEQRAFLTETLHLPGWISNQMYIKSGVEFPSNYYHPTFFYESMWNIIGFIIILVIRRTKWLKTGDLLAFYLIWYSTGRFFIEAMRTDSLYVGTTGIRTAQLISILMILGGIAYLIFSRLVLKPITYAERLQDTQEVADIVEKVIFDNMILEENLDLPSGEPFGLIFLWQAPKEHTLSSEGVIQRREREHKAELILTAVKDDIKVSKTFKFVIKAK